MEYIALAFLRDFLKDPLGNGVLHLIFYLPFTAAAIAAALLRITAYGMKLRPNPSHRARSAESRRAAPAP
jgi:hypothetical protein